MKKYFIDVQDKFLLENKKISIELLLELRVNDLNFSLELLFENSTYAISLPQKSYLQIENHYTKIINDFLNYLRNSITTHEQLKEFISRVEKPQFLFHKKLLNVFTQKDLEYIANKYFRYYPILYLNDFSEFLPIEINGWYINGIEIDTDLDDNEVPLIEDKNEKIISPSELLKILI